MKKAFLIILMLLYGVSAIAEDEFWDVVIRDAHTWAVESNKNVVDQLLQQQQIAISMESRKLKAESKFKAESEVLLDLVQILNEKGWIKNVVIGQSGLIDKDLSVVRAANAAEHSEDNWDQIQPIIGTMTFFLPLKMFKALYISGVNIIPENNWVFPNFIDPERTQKQIRDDDLKELYPDENAVRKRTDYLKKIFGDEYQTIVMDMGGVRDHIVESSSQTPCLLDGLVHSQFEHIESLAHYASKPGTLVLSPTTNYVLKHKGFPVLLQHTQKNSLQKVVRIRKGSDFLESTEGLDYYFYVQ